MKRLLFVFLMTGTVWAGELERNFSTPPDAARLHAYWWWLNGNVTKAAITRDLDAMKKQGFGGALITDAGGANQDGNRQVPAGPLFGSEAWRELYRHALREGVRLKLEMGLNIQSGWNLGGPRVTPNDAAKILCWTETTVAGGPVSVVLPSPKTNHGLLREVAVVAVPAPPPSPPVIELLPEKTLVRPVRGANFDTSFLIPAPDKDANAGVPKLGQIVNLAPFVKADGKLEWTAPEGRWRIYRFCYTAGPKARVSTCSEGWEGLAIDPMDPAAFQRYWDDVVEPLMQDAEQVGGQVLKYLHTDSWEIEPYNWTARLPEEFRQRCGYDLVPWLPTFTGRVVESREASERFLHDFRKTVAALTAEGYYGPFLVNAHRHGMQVRAESGGPHGVPIDAQRCLGMIDVPMSEFWATSWRHRVAENNRFFVKQPAAAAHTYGRKLVAAEGFTTIGPHWQERVWNNLKPNFDRALCEGLNQLVWTLVTCSPREMGMPGQEMFPGTHFNPNSTWWRQSEGFLSYINRCQWMLRQGLFVADVLYYYGDHAPNFAGLKASNPAKLPVGYDYDVADEHVLLQRVSVRDGRIVLPDGMSYAALVLPPHRCMSLPVLRKLDELAKSGATLIGAPPDSSSGLLAWQQGDAEAKERIHRLWGSDAETGLIKHHTAADWLKHAGLAPDYEVSGDSDTNAPLDYIHRRAEEADIYFVNNPSDHSREKTVRFRIKGKTPELWDPVSGTIRTLPIFQGTDDGRTEIPLAFEPYQSFFVIFRASRVPRPASDRNNFVELKTITKLTGPWTVQFDPAWFYPDNGTGGKMIFADLTDWTDHPDLAIKYYSGTATYRKTFDCPTAALRPPASVSLALGDVREMARVRLNDKDLGVLWCPPWNVRIPAGTLKEMENRLEIEVVNLWPNRLIGDTQLPPEQRRTKTNITKFENPKGDTHYTTLMPSGLLGPMRIMTE